MVASTLEDLAEAKKHFCSHLQLNPQPVHPKDFDQLVSSINFNEKF